jgi:hypothetical protein
MPLCLEDCHCLLRVSLAFFSLPGRREELHRAHTAATSVVRGLSPERAPATRSSTLASGRARAPLSFRDLESLMISSKR